MSLVGVGLGIMSAAHAGVLPKAVGKELAKECEQGQTSACVELAEKILDPGIAKIGHGAAAAAPWAKIACDRDVQRGCHLQGLTLEATLPRRRQLDGRRIVRWYSDACDASVAPACSDLYRFLGDWEPDLALEEDETRFMISLACAGGVADACEEDHEIIPDGHLTKARVTSIMRTSFPEVRTCGDRGSVSVRFVIDGEGRVTQLSLQADQAPDAEVLDCVQRTVGALRFPKPRKAGVNVSYVYRLHP
ncbi:MAG: AgmX/PglI C-terminal domain-containing protein [Myxococcales bacterium]|nr:AgmX/PglI C-terminal domain-containing protein [Myxococcales bacterium]